MFRIGCCIPGGSFMPQGVGDVGVSSRDILAEGCKIVSGAGFDYAEATVGLVMSLTEKEFDELQTARGSGSFSLEVCNSFIPVSLPIVSTPLDALSDYVGRAMSRMISLGADTVIFGSGKARSIPKDADPDAARRKIFDFIRVCDEKAEKYGMTVALEPLNSSETNFLNRVTEGAALVEKLGLARIKLLADAFHMYRENESPDALSLPEVKKNLVHVHVSEHDRSYAGKLDDGYLRSFAAGLERSGYRGRVTCECSYSDFAVEAPLISKFMREIF